MIRDLDMKSCLVNARYLVSSDQLLQSRDSVYFEKPISFYSLFSVSGDLYTNVGES